MNGDIHTAEREQLQDEVFRNNRAGYGVQNLLFAGSTKKKASGVNKKLGSQQGLPAQRSSKNGKFLSLPIHVTSSIQGEVPI